MSDTPSVQNPVDHELQFQAVVAAYEVYRDTGINLAPEFVLWGLRYFVRYRGAMQ